MSHSRIINDLANSDITLETALKRAKLLLHKLNDKKLDTWVNSELIGYSDNDELPEYRVISGRLMGNYIRGNFSRYVTAKNTSIPLGKAPANIKDELLSVKFFESVSGLRSLVDNRSEKGNICKPIPADYYGLLQGYIGDPYLNLTDVRVEVSPHEVDTILSCIEAKLLDILIKLEDEFGNLDELDIDLSHVEMTQIKRVIDEIHCIVYNKSITIGDGNTIKGSDISI